MLHNSNKLCIACKFTALPTQTVNTVSIKLEALKNPRTISIRACMLRYDLNVI